MSKLPVISRSPAAPEVPEEPVMVPIGSLVRDPRFQVRSRLDAGAIGRYANVIAEAGQLPPITVALVGGALIVVDGWHRIEAHERRGRTDIVAKIITTTASKAQWMAAAANLTHGVPLKKAEIRTAFRALICARQHITRRRELLSYRALAGLLAGAVRHTTLVGWMRKDFPSIARQMARDEPVKGTREATRDDEAGFFNACMAGLNTAETQASAVRSADRRVALIEAAERLLGALKRGDAGEGAAVWTPMDTSEDF